MIPTQNQALLPERAVRSLLQVTPASTLYVHLAVSCTPFPHAHQQVTDDCPWLLMPELRLRYRARPWTATRLFLSEPLT